jgi:predicted secreted Zn-dependent protease
MGPEALVPAMRRAVAVVSLASSLACGSSWPALPPVPGVRTIVDTTYYDADGRERQQWMASMRAGARRAGVNPPYVAYTRTQTRWRYTSARSSTGECEPGLREVEVTIRYIVPRLAVDTVDEEDLLEWRRYVTSLWRHEEGHGLRALREAGEMRDSLARVRTPACGTLEAAVTRAMDAVGRKYRRLQEDYDARTGHGARQGAVLLIPGAPRLAIDTTYRDTLP